MNNKENKSRLTIREAISVLNGDFSEVAIREGESHSDLFTIAFKMSIDALEKQIPKKPKFTGEKNAYGGIVRICENL